MVSIMKKNGNGLYENIIFLAIIQIILCTSTYFLVENVVFEPQTVTFINLAAACIIMLLVYNALQKDYLKLRPIVCFLLLMFVFNRLYDKAVFFAIFHFDLIYFLIFVGVVIFVGILLLFIKKYLMHFENNTLEDVDIEDSSENTGAPEQDTSSGARKMSHVHNPKKVNSSTKQQFFLGFFLILLVFIAGAFLFCITSESNVLDLFSSENPQNILLSLSGTFFLIIFATGMITAIGIKWIKVIVSMIRAGHEGDTYFLVACGLFLFSQYVFTNYPITIDNVADFFIEGKLFSFPLILSILIPVFAIFAENLIRVTSKNEFIKEDLDKCAKMTAKIATGIVKSLLTFIKFVTRDYLCSIIKLTKEDEWYDDDN